MAPKCVTSVFLFAAFFASTNACTDKDDNMVTIAQTLDPDSTITGCADAYSQNPDICNSTLLPAAADACCFTCECNSETLDDILANPDLAYWTETYVPYDGDEPIVPNACGYKANNPNRKHLHIALPANHTNASAPAPVLIFGHGNGGFASEMIQSDYQYALRLGYAVVSWESVTPIVPDENENDTVVCLADFELVMDWVVANGPSYGMSTDDWIVGGRSRGTICSWSGANSGRPAIKGMYMYNALPVEDEESWADGALLGFITTENSPPAYLPYGPCCPTPIIYEGDDACYIGSDIHNPRNGQRIVDRYTELGMADEVTLYQCMEMEDLRPLYFFGTFVESLDGEEDGGDTTPAPIGTTEDGDDSSDDDNSSVNGLQVSMIAIVGAMYAALA